MPLAAAAACMMPPGLRFEVWFACVTVSALALGCCPTGQPCERLCTGDWPLTVIPHHQLAARVASQTGLGNATRLGLRLRQLVQLSSEAQANAGANHML